jgi:hypothetical protein
MLINFLLAIGIISNIIPPVGRQYSKIITIPVLGKQQIFSEVLSKNTVGIHLKGIVNQNGTAKYLKNEMQELIVLSYNLRKTLKMLGVDFNKPEYDIESDRVIFRLKIKPVFYSKTIVLDRVHDCKSRVT